MIKIANFVFNSFVNDSRVLKESISLSNNGYRVTVVAHHDKNLQKEEKNDKFLIRRVAYLDRSITKGKLEKLKAYFNYIKESVAYAKGFEILHCNDINTLPIGVIIKRFYNQNAKIVYDAHEYETETYALAGIQKKIVKIVEKYLIKYADRVITVSDSIANEYVKLYGIPKPALVLNTPSLKEVAKYDKFREAFDIEGKTIFLYQGGLTKNRGIELLIEVFKSFNDNESIIVFMGYGDLETYVEEASKRSPNIFFHKAVSPEVLLDYTVSADFGISTIEDSCLSYRYCLPNKLFEYIMAEVPVVVSNLPEMKKIVEKNQIGVVVETDSIKGTIEAIEKAISLDKEIMKKNLKKAKAFYNWEEQERVLLKIYKELEG
jgi:glycosyltransferase involved in cell wall biosynthesis